MSSNSYFFYPFAFSPSSSTSSTHFLCSSHSSPSSSSTCLLFFIPLPSPQCPLTSSPPLPHLPQCSPPPPSPLFHSLSLSPHLPLPPSPFLPPPILLFLLHFFLLPPFSSSSLSSPPFSSSPSYSSYSSSSAPRGDDKNERQYRTERMEGLPPFPFVVHLSPWPFHRFLDRVNLASTHPWWMTLPLPHISSQSQVWTHKIEKDLKK